VLGAGFGGLELSTVLSEQLGGEVLLIDRAEHFVFGFSKLDVMFGRHLPAQVRHPYRHVCRPGLSFLQAEVLAIDAVSRRVDTSSGPVDADVLVLALGADLDPAATPGLLEAGHEFYTVPGAFALREVLARFPGGRVVVGVTSTPFKCPPAPSETALLMHDFLVARGLRAHSEVSLVMPLGTPIPPSPAASALVLETFAAHDIGWFPDRLVQALDPGARTAQLSDGSEMAYDLFLGVPVHRAPQVVVDSGLTVDGWIPVDPFTLRTSHEGVYAVGDVTSVGTPKAGVFAEGQAAVAAGQILADLRGEPAEVRYDGHGVCYMEVGQDLVAKVDVTFTSGERPTGWLEGPSRDIVRDKAAFGADRVARWFPGAT
jgi:sulfide:quinone oxidoreductase